MENVSSSNGLKDSSVLSPKLRFPEFSDSYTKIQLKEIAEKVVRTDEMSTAPVMMISAAYGFIYQSDKYSRDNAGKSLKKYTLLKKGELAYNHGASKLRQFGCCFELLEKEARIPYVYHTFKVSSKQYTPYIALILNNPLIDKQLKKLVSSSVRMDGLLNISYDEYMTLKINLPNIEEQKKIANFLTLLDERIAKQRELVESLKSYKRGALSAIFNRKIHFNDKHHSNFPDWNRVKLGDIFTERCERAVGNEELLAVTMNSGVIKRNEIELKDNSSDDKSNYKRVYSNDIAYNTMRMWQGASGVSMYNGIVSPAYTVIFANDENTIDIRFWGYYFKSYALICEFQKYSQGLTSDTWNLKYPQFAEIEVYLPCVEEQTKIADFLDKLEETILKKEQYLQELSMQRNEFLRTLFI